MAILIYSPEPAHTASDGASARRVASLGGLQIGFLGNLKPNADVLLHATEELVVRAGARGTVYREKGSCSFGAPAEMLDEIASTCQAAVVALGDCGSCTSWCIHDAVELDRRGIPSVTCVAEPFVELATHEARGLGAPDLKFVVLPYPMAGFDPDEIIARARNAFPEIKAGLVGTLTAAAS
jgi:hypothetical protein